MSVPFPDWVLPPPPPQASVSPPLGPKGEEQDFLASEGVGGTQFGRQEREPGTLYTLWFIASGTAQYEYAQRVSERKRETLIDQVMPSGTICRGEPLCWTVRPSNINRDNVTPLPLPILQCLSSYYTYNAKMIYLVAFQPLYSSLVVPLWVYPIKYVLVNVLRRVQGGCIRFQRQQTSMAIFAILEPCWMYFSAFSAPHNVCQKPDVTISLHKPNHCKKSEFSPSSFLFP